MTYAFIDTNLLMHFKIFEGMNWIDVLGDKDYCLMICPTVLDEIDKHKDSSKAKLRNRARNVFKILSGYLDGKSFNNINLSFCYENCSVEFSSSEYNGAREDDYIIAYAKAFTTDDRKVVVSNDIGMKFRAKKALLDFVMAESTSQNILASEPTDEDRMIKDLKQTLKLYENRVAKPVLMFRDEKTTLYFQAFRKPDLSEKLKEYEAELHSLFPYHCKSTSMTDNPLYGISNIVNLYNRFTDEDIDRYNNAIDLYIERMIEFRERTLLHSEINKHIFELQFSLLNKGNAPTGVLGLKIIFSRTLTLFQKEACVKENFTFPEKPRLETLNDKELRELSK